MKIIAQKNVWRAKLTEGEFNRGEHLFVEIQPCSPQTISCKLPNGEFVTFAFVPATEGNEFECVDIHSTVGKKFKYKPEDADDDIHFVQQAIGFSRYGNTVDTRKAGKPTGLLTLLLNKTHHA